MYLEHRDTGFPRLINQKGYKIGVEVGVRDGGYSIRLLRDSKLEKLYGIDIIQLPQAKNLEFIYPNRYQLLIKKSPDAASLFNDEFFDFIHIDAGHSYKDCKDDMEGWFPKLKKGGCFSGDDYIVFDNPTEGVYGVVQAVEEFVENNQIDNLYISGIRTYDKASRIRFATEQGVELAAKFKGEFNNFNQTPQWYFFKD